MTLKSLKNIDKTYKSHRSFGTVAYLVILNISYKIANNSEGSREQGRPIKGEKPSSWTLQINYSTVRKKASEIILSLFYIYYEIA
ncbi:hypothetical protein HCC47_01690 [Streptococcus suis]|nr:hypothetical protein [Streptococcus suis]